MLEMLRVFFPAAEPITVAYSHESFGNELTREVSAEDLRSVTLLSRVFSLLNIDLGTDAPLLIKRDHLDFDLALFSTYAN